MNTEHQELSFFAVWKAKGNTTAPLEGTSAIFHNANIVLSYNPAVMILGFD